MLSEVDVLVRVLVREGWFCGTAGYAALWAMLGGG